MSKNILAILANIVLFTIFIFFNVYSLVLNKTNHSGIKFYAIAVVILLFSFIFYFYLKKGSRLQKWLSKIFILLAIILFLNVVLFERLNIMMSYDFWLFKNMPGKYIGK